MKPSPWRVLGLLLPLVAASACGTSHAANSAHHGNGVPVDGTTTTSGAASTTSTVPSTPESSTTAVPTTVAGGSTSTTPDNLTITSSDVAALTAAFSTYTHVPVGDIAGVETGSVYMAEVPATSSYWALARFTPSAQAAPSVAASFQDGGNIGIFTRSGAGGWTMTRAGGEPFPCPGEVPANIATLWGLVSSTYCSAPSTAPAP